MKELIKFLNNNYENCYFYFKISDYHIELLYSNQKYQTDDEFLVDVFDICSHFLIVEEMWKLATCYDLNNEIPEEFKTQ